MKDQGWYLRVLSVIILLAALCATQPAMALVVTEVMYHPVEDNGTPSGNENLEFIELYNNRAIPENIGRYAFTNGVNYTFPAGTVIGAKEYIVIAKDPAAVQAAYGITGVYGPFSSGSLNNNGERIELSNANGEIIISFRYNDGPPWPPAADGTGHSLILAKPAGDPEQASSWAKSTFVGGSPGGPEQTEIETEDTQQVTLVDIGHTEGWFFRGTEEPSPGPGGEVTTEWTQINFNDNPVSTDWEKGPNGYGYSRDNDPDEMPYIKTNIPEMDMSFYSVYARLHFDLTADQLASFTQLSAEVKYDDQYVMYLNGQRVSASDGFASYPNPPAYNQAGAASGDALPHHVDLTSRLNLLVEGKNVLAIQAHNSDITGSSDCVAAPVLNATIQTEPGSQQDLSARLLINEMLTNSESGGGRDWVEIYNPGPVAVNLGNVYLSDGRFELVTNYKLPGSVTLQPGDFYTVDQDTLGFGLSSTGGETLFLTLGTDGPYPKPLRVLDAVRFGTVEADVTLGRYPNGDKDVVALSTQTRGTSNAKPWVRDIVINEIMYHHITRDRRYEYIELYNKSDRTISLEGWQFTDGVEPPRDQVTGNRLPQFPAGTTIAPNSYIVVAEDQDFLATVYPNLRKGVNLFQYGGTLDHHSERIRLSRPAVDTDSDGNPYLIVADEVTYYDGGRWSIWADGQGSSLELKDPHSNNNSPDAWAPSDDTSKSLWRQYTFTINGTDPDYTHSSMNVFGLMMLNRGEVLIDDIEVKIGGANKITNGSFESNMTSWRHLGNHIQSFVTTEDRHSGSKSLHVVATGHGDPGANRINQSIPSSSGTVEFRFWAKWLKGTRYMLLRTTQQQTPRQPPWPAHSFELEIPMDLGTPGRQNTAYVTNRGPNIKNVRHAPVLPASGEPIVVTAQITDKDGIDTVTLNYAAEPTPMKDDGSGNDAVANDGIYTATIPPAGAGTMWAFHIEASDGQASTRFPTRLPDSAQVPDRKCMVRVGDGSLKTEFAAYHVWTSNEVVNAFRSRPTLSNELMDCTFVYNDTDVFYNARIRFRGSPFLRSGFGGSPTDRRGYRIDFNSDQKFGGREEINLDNTESGSRGPLQERASYWFYRQMGLQYSMQQYVRPILNGSTHQNYEDVQKIDGDYVDAWFPDDNDGYIHKVDDYFEYTVDGTGFRNYDEGLKHDSAHPLIKETYRWGFEKRSHRENDTWDHILNFAEKMNTPSNSPDYEANVESVINPEHFAKVLAIRHAVGDWDSYGYDRGKNNLFYYADAEQKWYLLPWDIDFTLGSGRSYNANLFSVSSGEFPEVYRFMNYPKYRWMFWQAFAELVDGPWRTSYGTNNPPTEFDIFLDNAADTLAADGGNASTRDRIKAFVRDRRSYILGQLPESPVFEINPVGPDNFCTSDEMLTVTGVAPLSVGAISVNGIMVESRFSPINSSFEAYIPLQMGHNVLNIQGTGGGGFPVAGATGRIEVTRVPKALVTSVAPATVCNNAPAQLTIYGSGFETGSPTTVTFTSDSDEIGFDALYVKSNTAFDQIDAATVLLDDPTGGVGDSIEAVHQHINLNNSTSSQGEFPDNEQNFAAPYNTDNSNYAVRFTGYIYAPTPGVRYFGVNSNEGFSLKIDDQLVGEYADMRSAATTDVTKNRTAGTMTFDFTTAGSYYMVLDYFENNGSEEIEFFQTDANGSNRRLINVDSELVVFRDNVTRIDATDVQVIDSETITCQLSADTAPAGIWDVIVTPECGVSARAAMTDALQIIYPPRNPVAWTVTPEIPVDFYGIEGEPFAPYEHTFVLKNTGSMRLNWSIAKGANAEWLDLPIRFGTLSGGRTKSIKVRINESARNLPLGTYTCPVVFSVGCNSTGPSVIQRNIRAVSTYESDFSRNAQVDLPDLTAIADNWLGACTQPAWCDGTDLNKNGTVNLRDLTIFAQDWLKTVP